MRFQLHVRQKVYISIFVALAAILFVMHLNREAWFSLSLILPGVIPWSLFTGDAKRANRKFILIGFAYGSFIVWLGKTSVFAFFFKLGLPDAGHFLVQAIFGIVTYLILFVCARYSSELEAIENM